MHWNCDSCGKNNSMSSAICECGNGRPDPALDVKGATQKIKSDIPIDPRKQMHEKLCSVMEDGKLTGEKIDDMNKTRAYLNISDGSFRELLEQAKKDVKLGQKNSIALSIEPNARLSSGRVSQLRFHLKNLSSTVYQKVCLRISVKSKKNVLAGECHGKLRAGESMRCSISYRAPKDWVEDEITRLRLYLSEGKKPHVYQGIPQMILPISDPNDPKPHIHVQVRDYGVVAGDVGHTELESAKDDNPVPIELFYDAEESDRLQQNKTPALPKAKARPINYRLEIVEKGQTSCVYLIAKEEITIGRSSQSDILAYYLDKDENHRNDFTRMISKSHCRIRFRDGVPFIEDLAGSANHNSLWVSGKKVTNEGKKLVDGDTMRLGCLKFRAALFFDAKNPGICASLRLRYRNNPRLQERYLIIYSHADFGNAPRISLPISGTGMGQAGRFLFSGGLYVQSLTDGLEINGKILQNNQTAPLSPGCEIKAGETTLKVHSD